MRDSVDTMTGGGRQQQRGGRRAQAVGPSRPPTTGYDQVGEFYAILFFNTRFNVIS